MVNKTMSGNKGCCQLRFKDRSWVTNVVSHGWWEALDALCPGPLVPQSVLPKHKQKAFPDRRGSDPERFFMARSRRRPAIAANSKAVMKIMINMVNHGNNLIINDD